MRPGMEFPPRPDDTPTPQPHAETEQRINARKWLSSQGQRAIGAEFGGVSATEFTLLQKLIGHAGFGLFYSLLQYQRTEAQEQLSRLPLGGMSELAAASVLQGHVQALDRVRELLLDIADPSAQQGQGASE